MGRTRAVRNSAMNINSREPMVTKIYTKEENVRLIIVQLFVAKIKREILYHCILVEII